VVANSRNTTKSDAFPASKKLALGGDAEPGDEYAKNGIRVNAVAPGIVDTPLQKGPKNFIKTLQPLGGTSEVKDIVDAVVYLTEAEQVIGEVLHVDGGTQVGKW
jgi:NAD(P)-dependent dehydrogenase (short-subunit alcohol dehydrogenase family)